MRNFIILVVVAFLTTPTFAQQNNSESRIFPYDYEVRDLDNGLRVIVIPTDFPNIVSLQIPVSTGSRNEVEEGKSGFAHFFEHMMFRGTENYTADEYGALLKNAGADQNAYTTDDRTVYHITFSKEDLETILMLEADRFQHLQYSEADFRTEALAVLGEYNKNSANPIQKLFEVQRAAAFNVHTYQHTTMGFIEDIEDMPNEFDYSLEFFDRYYRPENSVVIVSGDVEPEQVFSLVEEYWGNWEPGYDEVSVPEEPAPEGPIYAHVNWETETLPWMTVGFRGPAAYPTEDNPAAGDMQVLDVLSQYAFSPSSALYQRLVVEEQVVDQFGAFFPDQRDPGLLTILARVKDPADLAYVREQIQETLAVMRTVLPDESRINDIKNNLKYSFAAGMDNSEALADAVVSYVAATRDVETINRVYANYDRVTPEDVMRAANTYFVDQGMIVTTLSTGELEGESAEVGSVDDKIAMAGNDPMPSDSEPPRVPRFEGVKPTHAPEFDELITQNLSPIIDFRLLFNVGSADDPAGKEGLATLTARMVADAGSESMRYAEIQQALFPLAAGFGTSVDKEMTVFTGSIHLDNLNRYYDIIAGQLFTPAFREEDFTRVKSNLLNEIRVGLRSNNDEELGKEVLYEMIYADHPYGHLNLGHVEAVEALTIEDVRNFYSSYYVQNMLTVGVSGNAPDDFLERLRSDLTGEFLQNGLAMDVHVAQAEPMEGLQVTLVDKDTRAAAISMGFPIDVRRGDPDFVALYLIRSYFGEHRSSNSYLYQRIREIRGMNYGDYAYIEYFPNGMFQFYPSPNLGRKRQIFQIWIRPVPPEQAHFAFRIAKYELDRLIRDGMTQEDFEATRNFLTKYVNVLTASQGRALGYSLDSDYYGITEFTEYIRSDLATLTLDDVNRALRRHLRSDNMAAVVITPDAASFRDALLADSPSPMEYASEKASEIYVEDEAIQQYPLSLNESDVRVVSVEDVFERRIFE